MLPKVAGHLLHHTSRAVAAVQSQTGHTIRNVLQSGPSSAGNLGTWNGPSASSSGWGSTGSGSGGAKFNSSSRYHSGYASTARVVSHADPAAANNGTTDHSDEATEGQASQSARPTARSSGRSSGRRRVRSTSVSLLPLGPQDQEGSLGVLKTVQDHIRARHAFAAPPTPAQGADQLAVVDPIPPETSTTNQERKPSEDPNLDQTVFADINAAEQSGELSRVVYEVQKLRTAPTAPSTALYNAGLQALYTLRVPGEPLHNLLQAYSDMLSRDIVPNYRTYAILILALTDRDLETQQAILTIQNRIKRRAATGTLGGTAHAADEQRIARLQSENNFGSALTLFQAASLIPRTKPHISLYTNLLRSCAYHANVDAAIHVFAHLEKRTDLPPTSLVYAHLVSTYTNAGDLQGAEEVFEEFKKAALAREGELQQRVALDRWYQIRVWNNMIEAYFRCGQPTSALGLLEQMMDSKAGEQFGATDIPPPSSSTFSTVISGFCQSGDVTSALSWFDRLLQQQGVSIHPLEPTIVPTKPDQSAWNSMLEALVIAGQVHDLDRLFEIATSSGVDIRIADRIVALRANLHYIESLPDTASEEALGLLDFLVDRVLEGAEFCAWPAAEHGGPRAICDIVARHYIRFGRPDKAVGLAEIFVSTSRALIVDKEADSGLDGDQVQFRIKGLRNFVKTLTGMFVVGPTLSLEHVLRIGALCSLVSVTPNPSFFSYYLDAYFRERENAVVVTISVSDWELLLQAALSANSPVPSADASQQAAPISGDGDSVEAILADMAGHKVNVLGLGKQTQQRVSDYLLSRRDASRAKSFLETLGPEYVKRFGPSEDETRVQPSYTEPTPIAESQVPAPTKHVHVDVHHSAFVDEYYTMRSDMSPLVGYGRFEAGMRTGVFPTPEVLGRLINGVGRLGHLDKVRTLYDAAQLVLSTLERDKHWQSVGWFQVEDQMIVALAHAGDTDGAHVHRNRILSEGGTPSADAYGALIQRVKDTTDDTANAMTLFQEAINRGVAPNIYLYNTMISKLAKARKADHALELFHEMKTRGARPTSVTYGAVIAACCRVGDAQSAELLFKEMATQPNFRPRVPPYNTMIQLYTHTKPDRERALFYFDTLQKAKVQPTAHTYKLLIDAYGTIEPVDLKSVDNVFDRLVKDPQVAVQGTHWAALINSWGCVRKDLDKAIAIFDSIATHPATSRSNAPLPDAVCFEALLNVLITLRRTDLIPTYFSRLPTYGIHMTAYIANLLIKGYAAVGDLEKARDVFESLVDPPEGVAAPNNHAPHDLVPDPHSQVPINTPVFREPSTWEAMVRAELGVGNRDRALALLERVQARRFPPAVYNRISGIMLDDDAVSPWASAGSEVSSL